MDEQTEGRDVDGLGTLRPALKRQMRWPAERKQRGGTQFLRKFGCNPAGPRIEGMDGKARFRRRAEMRPKRASDAAE
jgi:hypothetical protein